MSLQSFETWLLRDAGKPHRLHQLLDPAGRDAADPGFLDHRDQRLLARPARLQERREVRALAQLRDAQLERSEPRVEAPVAIAVAVIEPIGRALVPPGADQALDIGFHQDLQHRLRHGSQEVALAALLQQLGQRHVLLGHRVLGGLGVKFGNSTVADRPMTTCRSRARRAPCDGAFRPPRAHRRISTTSEDANDHLPDPRPGEGA